LRSGGREKWPVHLGIEVDGLRLSTLCEGSADSFLGASLFVQFLVSIVFQTILKLMQRFINCLDCFHAVPAKIMSGVLQVFLGPS